MWPTAILVDGGFFLKRYKKLYGGGQPPERIAKELFGMCLEHLKDRDDLYRIFFYDCPPLEMKAQHPITGRPIDFSCTRGAMLRRELHKELVKLRKVAVRRGRLGGKCDWVITAEATEAILKKGAPALPLKEADVYFDYTQKGVDMRIGLDIASLSFKRLVKRIVLVTGDSDFVPAAKFARREGIDVILNPMSHDVSADLLEHVDGVQSIRPRK